MPFICPQYKADTVNNSIAAEYTIKLYVHTIVGNVSQSFINIMINKIHKYVHNHKCAINTIYINGAMYN